MQQHFYDKLSWNCFDYQQIKRDENKIKTNDEKELMRMWRNSNETIPTYFFLPSFCSLKNVISLFCRTSKKRHRSQTIDDQQNYRENSLRCFPFSFLKIKLIHSFRISIVSCHNEFKFELCTDGSSRNWLFVSRSDCRSISWIKLKKG